MVYPRLCFVPLLFTLYTKQLIYVLSNFKTWIITFTKMTHKSISLWPRLIPDICLLVDCLQDVSLWMKNSKLKRNADKTEFLSIGTPTQCRKLDGFFPTHVLSQSITPATSMLNLAVTFDENFHFKLHVSKTCHYCFDHIRDFRHIRRDILLSVAKPIATALVSNILDYCNLLLYNIVHKDIANLQRILNCLARVATRSPRFSRTMPFLKLLHWLSLHYRTIFNSISEFDVRCNQK